MKGTLPACTVVVVGTGTEVGKTWVSAALLEACRAEGLTVVARKPAQSFEPGSGPTDAEILGSATGEDPHVVCLPHRWYPVPYAPPMAADLLEMPAFTVRNLLDEIDFPAVQAGLGIIEMAGGVASPIAHFAGTGQMDFVESVGPDRIVLVADAGLGTISAVLTALDWIRSHVQSVRDQKTKCVVALNRFDSAVDLHQRNATWLADVGVSLVRTTRDPIESGHNLYRHVLG
ncbi:MAG: dethiobiotin synthase [Acidimicrobiales bacterium]